MRVRIRSSAATRTLGHASAMVLLTLVQLLWLLLFLLLLVVVSVVPGVARSRACSRSCFHASEARFRTPAAAGIVIGVSPCCRLLRLGLRPLLLMML